MLSGLTALLNLNFPVASKTGSSHAKASLSSIVFAAALVVPVLFTGCSSAVLNSVSTTSPTTPPPPPGPHGG